MNLVDAVGSRDERKALEAMADVLALAMQEAEPQVVAQIAGRLQAVMTRLALLGPAEQKVSALDELAAARANRRAATKVEQTAAAGSGKRGS